MPTLVGKHGDAYHFPAMHTVPSNDFENLRNYLHERIDRVESSHLAFLNRTLQQLKVFELSEQLDQGFDADRAAGRLSPAAIAEAVQIARRARP